MRAVARIAFVVMGCGLLAAGCTTTGQPSMGDAGLSYASVRGTTVAFESIDGPPETVFRRLVLQLTQEAGARQVAVVSREQPAQYRIRGYMAAHVLGKRTTISWVWDIYDADRQRALRLGGEVPGGASDRNAWNAADDQVIGRIARDGIDRLAVFLANPNVPAPDQSSPYDQGSPGVAMVPGEADALAYMPSSPGR